MNQWRRIAFALLCASLILAPALADARAGSTTRSGGGTSYFSQGSRGSRTYDNNSAQPLQRSITPDSPTPGLTSPYGAQPSFAQRHPFLTGLAGGFLGSWIGVLLFPHWGWGGGWGFPGVIGSLFSWLFIIGLIWMAFRLFRGGGRPLTAPSFDGQGHERSSYARSYGGLGGGPVRSNTIAIDQADYEAFETILRDVQAAWSRGDLAALRRYATPEMLSYFGEQLAENASQGVQNHVEQVELLKGDLREAWDDGNLQYATAFLRWRALDYTHRTDRRPGDPGYLVDGDPQHPSEAQEMWTFARSPGGHWLLSAIQQV